MSGGRGEEKGAPPRRIGSTHNGARISRGSYLFQYDNERRGCRENLLTRSRKLTAHRNKTLRSNRVSHRLEPPPRNKLDPDANLHRSLGNLQVALERCRRRVHLDEQV